MLVAKVLVFYNAGEKPQLLLLKRTSKALVSPGMENPFCVSINTIFIISVAN